MVRITRVHTGGGNKGETSLVDGSRVQKSNLRIEVVGCLDELNSVIGIVRMEIDRLPDKHSDGGLRNTVVQIQSIALEALSRLQQELFDFGAELACPPNNIPEGIILLGEVVNENLIDEMDAWLLELPPLSSFILPTGSAPVAWVHVARTITRRLERRLVTLSESEIVRPFSIKYVNILSDWLFIFSRWITHRMGLKEVLWEPMDSTKKPKSIADIIIKQQERLNLDSL